VFPYTRNIVNVPTQSTNHGLENETVPFYQIVVHGLFNFAGAPLNAAAGSRDALLKAIETGSGLHFRWVTGEPSIVKGTDFDYLLNVAYDRWRDEAIAAYREANSVLKPVQGRLIDNHEKLADGVYRTTYDNGYAVIVNYNDRAVQVGELRVPAKGCSLQMGGEIR
jgi:hypothetical protein